jgi:glutamate decarboxylase
MACHDTAVYLAAEIDKLGPFELLNDGSPQAGIPAVSWKLREGTQYDFNLFDLADRLRTRGWLVPAYTMPAHREDMAVQRILVRHGFSRDLAALLMDDYRSALAHFDRHPVTTSLSEAEAGSFHH